MYTNGTTIGAGYQIMTTIIDVVSLATPKGRDRALALPNARDQPVTKTNWEGVGVKPDVEVPAERALEKALELGAKRRK